MDGLSRGSRVRRRFDFGSVDVLRTRDGEMGLIEVFGDFWAWQRRERVWQSLLGLSNHGGEAVGGEIAGDLVVLVGGCVAGLGSWVL
ncbi:hypothetical protein M0R45_002081 [Rubus argutus]|uniref:Uncharacterized protein n=1 Tax=Rubus argutus TaxID=59490 RepID=A0AAW1VHF2_RUBAR